MEWGVRYIVNYLKKKKFPYFDTQNFSKVFITSIIVQWSQPPTSKKYNVFKQSSLHVRTCNYYLTGSFNVSRRFQSSCCHSAFVWFHSIFSIDLTSICDSNPRHMYCWAVSTLSSQLNVRYNNQIRNGNVETKNRNLN